MLDFKKVLVTGGAGFIGSALIWKLNQLGVQDILVSDVLGCDLKFKNLIPLRFDDYIESSALLETITHKPNHFGTFSHVFHLGACSSTTEKDAAYLIQNNYEYTKFLCCWSLERGSRFVYASSAATYGNGSNGMSDQDMPAFLSLKPLNMYGYSKHLFDLYAHKKGFLDKIVGLKYFNVYGPNERHKNDMASLVYKSYYQILETHKIKLFKSYHPDYKDGEQKRDFLYVKDAVDMTVFLGQNQKAAGLYNVGSGVASTWLDLAYAVFDGMTKNPLVDFTDMPENIRSNYQYFTQADIGKLRQLGYTKEITELRVAVADYIQNYLIPGKYLGE